MLALRMRVFTFPHFPHISGEPWLSFQTQFQSCLQRRLPLMESEPHFTQRGSPLPGLLLIGVHPTVLSAERIFWKRILLLKKEKVEKHRLEC